MPAFTVIAGPNGSGKSSFSTTLSPAGALVFDPDKVKAEIWHRYPDISDEAVESELTRIYNQSEKQVLLELLHFTVETNLRNTFLIEQAKEFKKNKYEINLIYMMLPSVAFSMDRVALRVKRKGHFVDAESIRINFERCILHVEAFMPLIDNLLLLDGSPSEYLISAPKVLAIYKNRRLNYYNLSGIPAWVYNNVKYLTRAKTTADEEARFWRRELPNTT